MLINADVKSLEIFVAEDRYKDDVLHTELSNKLDLHALNQERFKLPTRTIAKIFIFKLLYGASAYGYSMDSDFIDVGFTERQWQRVIDEFYEKYKGIARGHYNDIKFVKENGYLETPAGRYFNFAPKQTAYGWKWPETKIKNYPIQSFGADLVKLARVAFFKRFKESGLEGEFIQTIHDSLVLDTPEKNVYNISMMLKDAVENTHIYCKEEFDYALRLPLMCEIKVGPNKADMREINFN